MLSFIPAPVRTYFTENPESTKYSRKNDATLTNSWIRTHTNTFYSLQAKQLLGVKGAEGKVKKGLSEKGESVAVKIINLEDRYVYDSQEIDVLAKLGRLKDVTTRRINETTRRLYIIQTLIPGQSLFNRLHAFFNRYCEQEKLIVAINLVRALLNLYEKHHIVHGDVKAENALVDDNLEVRLVDFGFSKILPLDATMVQGLTNNHTPNYGAPEVIQDKIYSPASDVYALGKVFKNDFDFSSELYLPMMAHDFQARPNYREILKTLRDKLKVEPLLSSKAKQSIEEVDTLLKSPASYTLTDPHPPTKTPWRRGY